MVILVILPSPIAALLRFPVFDERFVYPAGDYGNPAAGFPGCPRGVFIGTAWYVNRYDGGLCATITSDSWLKVFMPPFKAPGKTLASTEVVTANQYLSSDGFSLLFTAWTDKGHACDFCKDEFAVFMASDVQVWDKYEFGFIFPLVGTGGTQNHCYAERPGWPWPIIDFFGYNTPGPGTHEFLIVYSRFYSIWGGWQEKFSCYVDSGLVGTYTYQLGGSIWATRNYNAVALAHHYVSGTLPQYTLAIDTLQVGWP